MSSEPQKTAARHHWSLGAAKGRRPWEDWQAGRSVHSMACTQSADSWPWECFWHLDVGIGLLLSFTYTG